MKAIKYIIPLAALLITLTAAPAHAQAQLVDLGYSEQPSRTYADYDVTGDGKADTLDIYLADKSDDTRYMKLTLEVNGKPAYTKKYTYEGTFGATIKLITLKNGRVYLYLKDSPGDFTTVCSLYRFNGTKFVKSFDFRTLGGQLDSDKLSYVTGNPTGVSGNTITFREHFQCDATGSTATDMRIVYKSGKLKLATRYFSMKGINGSSAGKRYKLRTMVTAYPSATATKVTKKFGKGSLLKVTQLYIGNNGIMRFRVVNPAGRVGYLNAHKSATVGGEKMPLFEGLDYAG